MSNNLNITITGSKYYFAEASSSAPAEEALSKIQMIMKNKFEYDSSHPDAYSTKTQAELSLMLHRQARQIAHQSLKREAPSEAGVHQRLLEQAEIARLSQEIDNLFNPSTASFSCTPQDVVNLFAARVGWSFLRVAHTCKAFHRASKHMILVSASERGYKGNDSHAAREYVQKIFMLGKDLTILHLKGYLPKLNSTDVWDKFLSLTLIECLTCVAQLKPSIQHYLHEMTNLCVSKESLEAADEEGNTPLHLAVIHSCEKDTFRYLVSCWNTHKLSFNMPNKKGQTPLALAVIKRNVGQAKLLSSHGAKMKK